MRRLIVYPIAFGLAVFLLGTATSAQIKMRPVERSRLPAPLENPLFAVGPRPDLMTGTELVVVHVTAKPNERHRVIRYFNLGAKCGPVSPETIVLMKPRHGSLAFAPAKMESPKDDVSGRPATSFLPETDPRFGCSPSDVTAVDINFIPSADFVGSDQAQVAVIEHGHTTQFIFQIDVS